MDAEGLTRYADAIVRDALRLGDGDVLAVHGEPAHRELLVALAEAGYRAGCRYCDVLTTDLRVKRVTGARTRRSTRSASSRPGTTVACATCSPSTPAS